MNVRLWCLMYNDGKLITAGDNGSVYILDLGIKWQSKQAELAEGQYLWERIVSILSDGGKIVSDAVCIKSFTLVEETDPTVPAWAKASSKPAYTASEVGADVSGTAANAVSSHNTATNAHSDIRTSIDTHTNNKLNPHGVTKSQIGLGNVENKSSATIRSEITSANVTTALGYTPLNSNLKGTVNGVAELDANGKIPSSQLPSYVDDVIEGYLYNSKFYKESAHTTVITGETGKIYIDLSSSKTYRWSGSAFAEISASLALGETSSTAYRGDRGKTAYDHSQAAHAPSDAEKNQNAFSNVTVGSTNIAADSVTDTLTLVAGSNVTITPDATKGQITITATDTKYTLPSAGTSLGGVKSGGDVTISNGVITVNDDSHNHTIANVDGLQTALNGKANDFSIEIYNGTGGNPKPVRFASFNYSTCNSENGIAAKISLVSGHGNGSSYAFLQDAIIRVSYDGSVEVDNFKYYGTETGTYDGANRQYGDIFWLTDSTNKIIDFYCLMGQYSRVNQTPWKRLTYSTGGTVTQHTSCTVYSSGTKVWANNSDIALVSDISTIANNTTYTLTKSGSTITLTGSDGKTSSVTDADTDTKYTHPTSSGNKHIPSGGSSGQILRWSADGTATWGADNNTTYSQATSSTLGLVKIGFPESGKNYPVELNSSGQMYVNVPWTDNNTTYGVVSTTANGLAPKRDGSTTKFLRADGTWAVPPDTNTVYTHPSTHAASMITGLATVATSGNYNDLSNKPTVTTVAIKSWTSADI